MTKYFFLTLSLCALFLAQCKTGQSGKTGTTPSGFKYEFIHDEKGETPKVDETAFIQFEVYLGDSLVGSTWDQTEEGQPFTMYPQSKIDSLPDRAKDNFLPIHEIVSMMSVGDTVIGFQPIKPEMRAQLPPFVGEDVTEVKRKFYLVKIRNQEQMEEDAKAAREKGIAEQEAAMKKAEENKALLATLGPKIEADIKAYKTGKLDSNIETTDSGLKIYTLEAGTGEAIKQGEKVAVDYYGALVYDGAKFDDSFSRGRPLEFRVGIDGMIQGFTEGVLKAKHGQKMILFIPSALGYGSQGNSSIPPDSELAFYIEVL